MDGIAWGASAMIAARTRLEIATENLANASTDGFVRVVARGFLKSGGAGVVRHPEAATYGALRRTGRDLDLAIAGPGTFAVADAAGRTTHTRAGSFSRESDGSLRDPSGRTLVNGRRPVRVPEGARFDERGCAVAVDGSIVARVPLPPGSTLRTGFLETSSVDAIHEMIDVLSAERSFESAEKVVASIDRTREKSSSDVARVK
jgi:flagellar basal body rod protein FlgG